MDVLTERRATLTVEEAARLLGVGRGSAYEAAHRGEIPTMRIGRRLLVPVPALLRLLGAVDEADDVEEYVAHEPDVA